MVMMIAVSILSLLLRQQASAFVVPCHSYHLHTSLSAASTFNDQQHHDDGKCLEVSRRRLFRKGSACAVAMLFGSFATTSSPNSIANAAPPIAVIAEELGYFPVQNREGQLMYVPKKVQRQSSQQAIELAKFMSEQKGITFFGAYWCPHCSRQKELFGAEAWKILTYQECSPKGYGYKGTCKNVDGYPTFMDKKGKIIFSGERSLEDLALQVGYKGFDPSLETDIPPMIGASTCKLPGR